MIRWNRYEIFEKQQMADLLKERVEEIAKQILELFNLDWAVEYYRKDMNKYEYNFVRPFFDPEGTRSSPKDRVLWEHDQKIRWLTMWYWEGKYAGIPPGDKIQKINEDEALIGRNAPNGGFVNWFEQYRNSAYSYWNAYNNPEEQARRQGEYEKFMKNIFGNTIQEAERKMKGNGKPATLTLHWADWCPHCHDMMPEWKKMGSEHKGVLIRAIEQKQSGFKGPFPAILFQHGNNMEKYEGPRTKAAFAKFLKNKLA
jgi:thiol-disulfide isomerase/thioredoxin